MFTAQNRVWVAWRRSRAGRTADSTAVAPANSSRRPRRPRSSSRARARGSPCPRRDGPSPRHRNSTSARPREIGVEAIRVPAPDDLLDDHRHLLPGLPARGGEAFPRAREERRGPDELHRLDQLAKAASGVGLVVGDHLGRVEAGEGRSMASSRRLEERTARGWWTRSTNLRSRRSARKARALERPGDALVRAPARIASRRPFSSRNRSKTSVPMTVSRGIETSNPG